MRTERLQTRIEFFKLNLLYRLYSDAMTDACQSALLEIQYFVARDFRLDPQLYTECLADAVHFCGAPKNWTEDPQTSGPSPNPLVLPCLYRYAYHSDAKTKLADKCVDQVGFCLVIFFLLDE